MIQIRTGSGTGESTTLDSPLDHLMACHRRIEERLATLERAAATLPDRRDDALAAIRSAFRFMDSNGVIHTRDEEESIFPRLHPTDLIHALEAGHREAERIDRELRDAFSRLESGDNAAIPALQSSIAALCAVYRHHIQQEDSLFIPAARSALSPDQLQAVSHEMKARRGLA
jgi:hemerythrin-like domain-containing protein